MGGESPQSRRRPQEAAVASTQHTLRPRSQELRAGGGRGAARYRDETRTRLCTQGVLQAEAGGRWLSVKWARASGGGPRERCQVCAQRQALRRRASSWQTKQATSLASHRRHPALSLWVIRPRKFLPKMLLVKRQAWPRARQFLTEKVLRANAASRTAHPRVRILLPPFHGPVLCPRSRSARFNLFRFLEILSI